MEYRGRVGTGIGHHALTEAFGKSVDISFPAADEKPAREKTVPSYLWFLVRILDD